MQFIIEIIYAIIFIALGLSILKYRRTVKSWTGKFYWAEKYIGSGGTYFVIMMIGLALIFFGATYPFGGAEFIKGVDDTPINTIQRFP